ncbi:MAG: alkaline phosphatase family protein [Gammaproteobacteria bacterium]
MNHLLKLSLSSILLISTQALSAEPWFMITTDTPQLTMNQSMPEQSIQFSFSITNNIGTESGPITISDIPKGVSPANTSGSGICVIQNYDATSNKITIGNLNNKQVCELDLEITKQSNLSSTRIKIDPKVCAKDNTRCSKTINEEDSIQVYVIDDFQKVVILVFENEDAEAALSFPTFTTIAEQGAYFDNYHAVARPSLPNYLSMIAGSYFGVNTNGPVDLNETTIVDLLEANGRSWKVYAEDYPESTSDNPPGWNTNGCYIADAYPLDTKLYRRKHNAFMNFITITNVASRCAKIVNAENNFSTDLTSGNLPDYSFFIPNIPHSGHDDMNIADQWLNDYMYPLMQNQMVVDQNILFIIWFDESNPNGTPDEVADNRIYTVLYGPMVNTLEIDKNYNFYNMLRTIEDIWQLGTLDRNDATSSAITPIVWKN